jgi:hypothetical protein
MALIRYLVACCLSLIVLIVPGKRAEAADANFNHMIATMAAARVWSSQHVPSEFRHSSALEACVAGGVPSSNFVACRIIGARLVACAGSDLSTIRLACETYADMVFSVADALEVSSHERPEVEMERFLDHSLQQQQARLRIILGDAKKLGVDPVERYAEMFIVTGNAVRR